MNLNPTLSAASGMKAAVDMEGTVAQEEVDLEGSVAHEEVDLEGSVAHEEVDLERTVAQEEMDLEVDRAAMEVVGEEGVDTVGIDVEAGAEAAPESAKRRAFNGLNFAIFVH
jgi:hypothetical protein